MRVLHAIGEMGAGGAESMVVEMVHRGCELGWHSAVASAGGYREDQLVRSGEADAYRVPLSRRRPVGLARAAGATQRAISQAQPDAIIAHNVGVTAAVALAQLTRGRRVPVVSVIYGLAAEDYRKAAAVLNVTAQAVVAVSDAIAQRLLAAGLRRTVTVIPNAVTAAQLPPKDHARRALGLDPVTPVALCAARLVEQKRHDVLLQAWHRVPPPGVLLLAGDGPERAPLQRLGADLGLDSGRLRFLGDRNDMRWLLAAADVATLASDWEGLPIFVLEAMAVGVPVVATDVDGVREILSRGGGRLVPPREPEELAQRLQELLVADDARSAASQEAKAAIAARYDPALMMRRYDELIQGILNGAASR